MKFDDYQIEAHKMAIYPHERGPEYLALGLASEAGEVAGKIKKQIRDGQHWTGEQREEHRRKILDEAGDVLWYLAELCTHYDHSLEALAQQNILKLTSRQQRGVIGGSGDNR